MEDNFYSKEDIYKEKIDDYVKKIRLACNEYKIPMFMSFAVENSKNNTKYITEMQSAQASGTLLTNDRLVKHAMIMQDFDVIPHAANIVFKENVDDSDDATLNDDNLFF